MVVVHNQRWFDYMEGKAKSDSYHLYYFPWGY